MNKPQFTPGPWRFWDSPDRPSNYDLARLTAANGRHILFCYGGAGFEALGTSEENQANARLIASAPDLYAALENQVNCWEAMLEHAERLDDSGMAYSCRNAIHHARAAIAKATATSNRPTHESAN